MTEAKNPVRLEKQGDIALILVDNPPVNATSQAVRQGLQDSIRAANADSGVKAIVIACDGRTFIAGGDIKEFGKPSLPPALTGIIDEFEASQKPVVAAIHGTAFGGGLEIGLGCHARILHKDAQVGLPEVKIGIIPGAGGTQRLPRLIGMLPALDMITTGKPIKAKEALERGIADKIAEGDLREEAIALAKSLIGKPVRRTGEQPIPPFDAAEFAKAVAAVKKKSRGQISPGKCADSLALAAELPIAEGLKRERAIMQELVGNDQAKALRHAFFSEREVMRVPHLEGVAPRKIESAGVIGAGTMGSGIAVSLLDSGLPVTIVETSEAAIEGGKKRVAGIYDRYQKSGRVTQSQRDERLARLSFALDYSAFAHCDVVIEAAFEEMGVKREIFGRLAKHAKAGAILASNTSYLDINEIAEASGRPQDVIGLHFFAPANIMRLVEVVEGAKADKTAVAAGVALVRRMGKVPVVCGVCDGFVGNRILAAWRPITEMALEDGALPQDIDAALEAFGFAMGPYATGDLSGLDIGMARRKSLAGKRNPAARYASTVADRLCELGRFGQKTGSGWYKYVDGKREIDPEVTAIIEQVSKEKGITRKPLSAGKLQAWVLATMVNEGAKILAEGIVPRSLDIDVTLLNGYGYPAFKGGPMFAGDLVGLPQILQDMKEVHTLAGVGFEPAPLLIELAGRDAKFGDLKPGEGRRN